MSRAIGIRRGSYYNHARSRQLYGAIHRRSIAKMLRTDSATSKNRFTAKQDRAEATSHSIRRGALA